MACHGMYGLSKLTTIVYRYDGMNCNNLLRRRVAQDIHTDKKLEIVEVYNEMIKSTTTANGKTAALKVTLIQAVVEV